ncbi:hypothetical protein HJ526_19025 [Donghicola sp. C2-DW-16]|uniref:Peptidase metallopeptidase domain-containing protein n=1 Tax=Donghicola mangrovi TaxID=2729614 RepID=A0ABX2PJ09_9RHOB|nr:M10 family metallopeptidase C-terminal domain-containing protein [Donghicola mangrovi]NVO29518.1 hypothetical protein [Donghicola mangrovi]
MTNQIGTNVQISADQTALEALAELYPTLTVYTLEQQLDDIDNLRTWTTDTVTFSFPTVESTDYVGNWREGTLYAFTEAQAAATREAIALIGDLVDVTFVDAGTDVDAQMRFYNSSAEGTAGGAPAGEGIKGDMWLYGYTPETAAAYNLEYGRYHFNVLLHEIGHIMGLSHTSFTQDSEDYIENAHYLQNNGAYSIMSYLTASDAGLAWDTGYSATPMIADIAALQSLYGANMITRTGDTVYGFNSTADRTVFDFDELLDTQGMIPAVAVWDAGGTDTLDMSGFSNSSYISLVDGTISSINGYDLNFGIAANAIIENAIGGNGDDILVGNAVKNVLTGGYGADTLLGGAGKDKLVGDFTEAVTGDFEIDSVVLDGDEEISVEFDGTGVTDMTVEMMISFDDVTGSSQWFTNMPGAWNLMFSGSGNGLWYRANSTWFNTEISHADLTDGSFHRLAITFDSAESEVKIYLDGVNVKTLDAAAFPDLSMSATEELRISHDGAVGDIRVYDYALTASELDAHVLTEAIGSEGGLLAAVVVDAATGTATDIVSGSAATITDGAEFATNTTVDFDDVMYGGDGNDRLFGGIGDDRMYGDAGNDFFAGDTGADLFDGGDGKDIVDYRDSTAGVTISLDGTTGSGGHAEGDVLTSIEKLRGSNFDDALLGSAGNDTIWGHKGSDTIDGGAGNDLLYGCGGKDTFAFNADEGWNRIKDFKSGADLIEIAGVESVGDLSISDHNLGAKVAFGGTQIILMGLDAADLTAADFGLLA